MPGLGCMCGGGVLGVMQFLIKRGIHKLELHPFGLGMTLKTLKSTCAVVQASESHAVQFIIAW